MELSVKQIGPVLTVLARGRIDMLNTPTFEFEVNKAITDEVKELILDFTYVEYLSSLGLRIVLELQKKMNAKGGTMKLMNVNDNIMDIFEITGFTNILTIENA
ncbi:MAG: STAS domain-containing protein [Candidatus Gastranaerophilales bacterium]|nr:STAS domain-containing protein [Candidatus Gastranaerophilales bacterium]